MDHVLGIHVAVSLVHYHILKINYIIINLNYVFLVLLKIHIRFTTKRINNLVKKKKKKSIILNKEHLRLKFLISCLKYIYSNSNSLIFSY